ncbi:MAG TPA: universal stress protein [Vicinamibacterales bacterium]|nr:universal stress protein [Vicinamibacterales bacterium]
MTAMREILLHGGPDEAFDRSVLFARRMAESFGARLHVLYTVEEPLSAGWTAEVSAERLPEVHEAMEAEARERLSRLIPYDDQERLGVQFVLRTGPPDEELVRYTIEHNVDLAIVQARGDDRDTAHARALLERGRCAVLVLR